MTAAEDQMAHFGCGYEDGGSRKFRNFNKAARIYLAGLRQSEGRRTHVHDFHRCTVRLYISKVHTPTNAPFVKFDNDLKFT